MAITLEVRCGTWRETPRTAWYRRSKKEAKARYLSREAAQDLIAQGWRVAPLDFVPESDRDIGGAYTPIRFKDTLPIIPSKWP